jgi:nucleoside-diphosphate-sugar epimerase
MERGTPGESYIIAGPVHTLTEGLAIAQKISGVPAPRLHPSPRTMKTLAAVMGLVGKVVPLPEMFDAETLRVTAGVTYLGSNAKATRELGFRARPLDEGLRETLDYEMRNLGMRSAA